jgi:hypothetical protein
MEELPRTVQSGIHATEIDQQTDHGHADSCGLVILQLVLEDLAGLAAPGHSINVDIREIHSLLSVGVPRKDWCFVFKHQLQELILDVFAPQWNTIFFLEVSNLVARVDRANRAICLSSCTDRRAGG